MSRKHRSCLMIGQSTYVMYALLHLLRHTQQQTPKAYTPLHAFEEVLARSLSGIEDIIRPFVDAGVLEGKRGLQGGYRLGPDAEGLTMLELVALADRCEPRQHAPLDSCLAQQLARVLVFKTHTTH